jgi:hypothetical protein
MSKFELKVVEAGGQVEELPGEELERAEELPPLRVDPTSFDARMAGVEPCSVARELTRRGTVVAAYRVKQAVSSGEVKTPQEREQLHREAWRQQMEDRPADLGVYIERIRAKAAQFIDWGDIGRLWNASPQAAMELWREIRLEARDEFVSGHYGARAFESVDFMHEAFRRAQYLAVRDGLIEEWRPRGASEFILIDQMTQSYVMQIHWTEEAMRRGQTEPRAESEEYRQYAESQKLKARQWEHGHWDVPYQHQAEAVEQAFRLVDLCQKAFQRAARQLANIRLVRAKTARAKRREKATTIKAVRVA